MATHKELYKEACKIYKSRKGTAVMVSIISFLVKFAVYFAILTAQFMCAQIFGSGFITGIPSIFFYILYLTAFVFVHIPINTGASVCYANIAMKRKVKTDDVFKYFKHPKKAIRCQLPTAIKVALCTAGWYVVGSIAASLLDVGGYSMFSAVGIFTTVTIIVFAVISAVAIIISYSAVTYVMAKDPDLTPRRTIKMAEDITRYHRADMFLLYLRNIKQYLLCIITLGIWLIWTVPFMNILNKRYIRYFCD